MAPRMTYGEVIIELFKRSGLEVKKYAEEIDHSVTHLSNIINGTQPGSPKTLKAALVQANLTLEQCLRLPLPANATDAQKALDIMEEAISIGGGVRDRVIEYAMFVIGPLIERDRAEKKEKQKRKKGAFP